MVLEDTVLFVYICCTDVDNELGERYQKRACKQIKSFERSAVSTKFTWRYINVSRILFTILDNINM